MLYVIGSKEDWRSFPIKIGFTDSSPEERLSSIQTGNPLKLDIIHLMDGDVFAERQIHSVLCDYRLAGEWFDSPQIPSNVLEWIVSSKSGVDAYCGAKMLLLGLESELISIQRAREKLFDDHILEVAFQYITNIYAHRQADLLVQREILSAQIEANTKVMESSIHSIVEHCLHNSTDEYKSALTDAAIEEIQDIPIQVAKIKKDAFSFASVASNAAKELSLPSLSAKLLQSHSPKEIVELISMLSTNAGVKQHKQVNSKKA